MKWFIFAAVAVAVAVGAGFLVKKIWFGDSEPTSDSFRPGFN